jgi:hypothetical protein
MALWCDLADAMVARVSHKDVVYPIHCDSTGGFKLSDGPFSVLITLYASTRQSGHMALRCNLADTMTVRVSHDDVPVPIQLPALTGS